MQWYYVEGDERRGPVSDEDIRQAIRSGRIERNTLVWKSGLAQWVPAVELADLDAVFHQLPPPIPKGKVPPPLPELVASKAERLVSPQAGVEAGPDLARPWPRFWARTIDMLILLSIVSAAIAWMSARFAPQFHSAVIDIDYELYTLISLPLVQLLLAVMMTVAGTTIGKAILGIRVTPPPHVNRLLFHIGRELRVWLQGLALGIPIFMAFAEFAEYRRVAKGRPASYDGPDTLVQGRPSGLRVSVVAVLGIALLAWAANLHHEERLVQSALRGTQTWVNPITNRATEVPGNWNVQEMRMGNGRYFHFSSETVPAEILFGHERFATGNMTSQSYANGIKKALEPEIVLTGDWRPVTILGRSGLRASGKVASAGNANVEVTLVAEESHAWRVLVSTDGRLATDLPGKDRLIDALFQTAR